MGLECTLLPVTVAATAVGTESRQELRNLRPVAAEPPGRKIIVASVPRPS